MQNKFLRLVEIIQDDYPGDILSIFKSTERPSLDERIALVCEARNFHQMRSEALWRQAGEKRSPQERQATAQAELASFVFACLTGDAKEHTDSATGAMVTLGRQGETDIIKALSKC